MEGGFTLVLLALANFNPAASVEDNTTTLEDVYFEYHEESIYESSLQALMVFFHRVAQRTKSNIQRFSVNETTLPLKKELLKYLRVMQIEILKEISSDLGSIPVQYIYDDINYRCGDYLESPILNLTAESSNVTCVKKRMWKILTHKLDIEAALQKFSHECMRQQLPPCQKVHANCTTAYEERVGQVLSRYFIEEASQEERARGSTPLEIAGNFVIYIVGWLIQPYTSGHFYLWTTDYIISSVPSLEPFAIGNLIRHMSMKEIEINFFIHLSSTQSQNQLTWGIVKSDAGSVDVACSRYEDTYSRLSVEYYNLIHFCYTVSLFQSNLDFFTCAITDHTSTPLTWSTVPFVYFHSQCLCLAYNGTDCSVKAPQDVSTYSYCVSLLLRDLQRQVSYRPAITYMDYAFKTRVPICQFISLLFIGFYRECKSSESNENLKLILSAQCYFKGLVNKHINCSETQIVNTYNKSELCVLLTFMQLVPCDIEEESHVTFYSAGDSYLVLFLTYGDVVVRVLTMVTFLACPKLRNLPGKLLIAYLVTTLLRLIVVRATLADMAMAVRLDVTTDLASTLWLTGYLHFLTVSIRDLRTPDSLSRDEARMVLLRYSLLGWILPVVLSPVFFWMDEVIDSRVNIGQLLFLICNYVALLGNLYMCYINCSFYYDVKNNARKIKRGARKRDVFAAIFNFAIKTSVLSGAGIIFRLIFTQIQGLEQLLGYYHVISALQGLLVFLLYGCNHEARTFWLQVIRSLLSRFRPRQNAPV